MTNGKVSFEIEGIKRSLYFGMVATEIFAQKAVKTSLNPSDSNNIKAFAYLVYAGLCNQADLLDNAYPKFDDAYQLTERIIEQGEELQMLIYDTWAASKPAKNVLDKLPKPVQELTPSGKKKELSKTPKIGMK